MSKYLHDTLILLVLILATGIVGALIGALWYKSVAPSQYDRDTTIFIVKLFSVLTLGMVVAALLYRYM